MSRTASNPLPQFITSPDLGRMIAAELHCHADRESKTIADGGGGSPLESVRLQMIRSAADQLDTYHRQAVVR
jgi:hypothetical protein